jgi:hypothetical protein
MENIRQTLTTDFNNNSHIKTGSQDVLLKLDSLLLNIDELIEKMRKTGLHVEKVRNNPYFH